MRESARARERERDRCSSRKYNLGLKEEANVAARSNAVTIVFIPRVSRVLISLSLVSCRRLLCLLSFLPSFLLSFFLSFPPSFTSPPPPSPFVTSLAHFAFQLALSLHGNSTRPTAHRRAVRRRQYPNCLRGFNVSEHGTAGQIAREMKRAARLDSSCATSLSSS